MLQDRF